MVICGLFSAQASADYTDRSLTVEKNNQAYVVNADGSFVLDVERVSRINEERAIKPNAEGSVRFNRTLETVPGNGEFVQLKLTGNMSTGGTVRAEQFHGKETKYSYSN